MSHFVLADWREKVVYSDKGPQPQVLQEDGVFRVIVSGLQAGASIPIHPELGSVYYILQGNGWMTVDGERFPIQEGSIIGMSNGATRGMEAETQLAFLAVRQGST